MLAVNYTELRGNMKECMDKVSDDFETLIVTRKKNKNIVMISEETYNNMMENIHPRKPLLTLSFEASLLSTDVWIPSAIYSSLHFR